VSYFEVPISKVDVEYDKTDSRLIKISRINDEDAATPPFSILYFEIHTASASSDNVVHEPIREIRARHRQELEISFGGNEKISSQIFVNILWPKIQIF
jgi:hypothetical protein